MGQGLRCADPPFGLSAHGARQHSEILRDAVLAEPDCDAYLFVDCDVCFTTDHTIDAMVDQLDADSGLFAVEATWAHEDGTSYDHAAGPPPPHSRIRESVRFAGGDWCEPYEFDVGYGSRLHPFCTLVRNDAPFRTAVELLGLSPAMTQCVRGALFFDTFGLLTQVMGTHGRTWARSSQKVIHFASVSWQPADSQDKALRRDVLLSRYRIGRPPEEAPR